MLHVFPTAGAANEGVLANFFNSLLSKKTGSPGSPGSGAVGAGVQGSAKKTGTSLIPVLSALIPVNSLLLFHISCVFKTISDI